MKKVFIVHGLDGSPNGGWRPWLMGKLQKINVYACALSMPKHGAPILNEWLDEVGRHVESNQEDEIYLVGHSLGVPTILKYLESMPEHIRVRGAVLVSGPAEKTTNEKVAHFLSTPLDFEKICSKVSKFAIIHGDDDPVVPISNGGFLAEKLQCDLIVIHEGKHLNGSAGFLTLPECLKELEKMFM
jgi:predicted alpha/beta hydrolase family esterase